jgi:hypothetical protein
LPFLEVIFTDVPLLLILIFVCELTVVSDFTSDFADWVGLDDAFIVACGELVGATVGVAVGVEEDIVDVLGAAVGEDVCSDDFTCVVQPVRENSVTNDSTVILFLI